MIRKIIKIDEDKCDGCGLCATACHESAIGVVNGKAKLLRDDYCDGLGNCLPACPTRAIFFEEREAAEYDEEAVKKNIKEKKKTAAKGGCPGSNAHTIQRETSQASGKMAITSRLNQWPIQIRLVPINAPYFENANLLVSADCCAYAQGNFHEEFMRNKITLIGCSKLDNVDYSEKLTEIIARNNIKSVTVVRMEVPCCGGIENAAKTALKNSGKSLGAKMIPWRVITLSTGGEVLEDFHSGLRNCEHQNSV
ncbi:MAG: 4Fe-4S binding protein [Synergistaceae bacterium]|jgi:ferredoxin|nr:4Fe-4S binding protein [Synergistaceae bacterium]